MLKDLPVYQSLLDSNNAFLDIPFELNLEKKSIQNSYKIVATSKQSVLYNGCKD